MILRPFRTSPMHEKFSTLTRRQMALGLGASFAILGASTRARAEYTPEYDQGWRVLRAKQGKAPLRGADKPPTTIFGYDGIAPGPLLRVKRGEELRVRLINELDDANDRPLARTAAAERNGRRAVSDPAAGRAGRELRLSLHAARRRHVLVPRALSVVGAGRPRTLRTADRRRSGPGWRRPRCRAGARRLAAQFRR